MTLSPSSMVMRYFIITPIMTKCLWRSRWKLLSTGSVPMGMLLAQWKLHCGQVWLWHSQSFCQVSDGSCSLRMFLSFCCLVAKFGIKGGCKELGRQAVIPWMARWMVNGWQYFGPAIHVTSLLWQYMVQSQIQLFFKCAGMSQDCSTSCGSDHGSS